jgi:hypothetical protein
LQFAQTSRTNQKLQKSMSLPTLQTERKIKYENTTMCILHSTLRDATTPYTERCVSYRKRPTAQTAHLVFADTQSQRLKTKRACFLPTLGRNNEQKKVN